MKCWLLNISKLSILGFKFNKCSGNPRSLCIKTDWAIFSLADCCLLSLMSLLLSPLDMYQASYQTGDLTQKTWYFIKIPADEHEMLAGGLSGSLSETKYINQIQLDTLPLSALELWGTHSTMKNDNSYERMWVFWWSRNVAKIQQKREILAVPIIPLLSFSRLQARPSGLSNQEK